MVKAIRRVVTGHDARGKSVIVSDGPSPHVLLIPGRADFGLTNLWVTDGAPGGNEGNADAAARPVVLEPPAGGTIFRVVEFPPDKAADFDRNTAFSSMGADHAMDPDASRHPGMHKTDTVDYAIVLSGEIWALMDEGKHGSRPATASFSAAPTTRGPTEAISPASWPSSSSARTSRRLNHLPPSRALGAGRLDKQTTEESLGKRALRPPPRQCRQAPARALPPTGRPDGRFLN